MIIALTTSRNKPKVKIVIGNVSSTRNGFTNAFKSESTIARTIADQKEEI
jgi:hypothetical protein